MKVLMINSVCGIRSTGRICTDLAVELEKQGHEVKIAYGREAVPKEFERFAVRIGTDLDVKLHGLKARIFDAMGFGSKNATKKFIKWVKEYDPDVIHLHNIHGYYINIEVLFDYLKTCGKRIIWTLHDCWAFTGHSAYCDSISCERWVNGCYDCPLRAVYPKSFIDSSRTNWLKKKRCFADIPNLTIVTPSLWLKSLVESSFFSYVETVVIHNGVDTSAFMPITSDFKKEYSIENKYALLGVATSWTDMKGYSDFLLLSDLIGKDYQIILLGLTEKQIMKLPKSIIGITRTTSITELAMIYSGSDLLVNLTYCDTYPTVNLEAILCGTPVLSYDTGGCAESIGTNGVIVPKGNIQAVLEAVNHISSNPVSLEVDRKSFDRSRSTEEYVSMINGIAFN